MNNNENLKQVIDAVNTGKKYPALHLVRNNPEVAALISKLFKPRDPAEFDIDKKQSYYTLNQSQVQAISDNIKGRINDNKNILQLFPDIELAIQIIVSSILSPKDMVKTEIIYKTHEQILPAELTLKLNSIIEKHLNGYYKIKSEATDILRETLFDTGSYIKVVIPEGILDEVINKNNYLSTESLTEIFENKSFNGPEKIKSLGILGSSTRPSRSTALERFVGFSDPNNYSGNIKTEDEEFNGYLKDLIDVTDNYKVLKLPKVLESHNENKLKSILNPRLAAESKLSTTEMSGLLYRSNQNATDEFVVIPTINNAKRKSVGRPLVLKLPSESVIPVYIPGDETKHIGYFVLIDIDGNPVTVASSTDHFDGLSLTQATPQGNKSLSSLLIEKAKKNLTNSDAVPTIDQITKVYSSILEKDLIERLRNGIYNSNISISNNNEVYRVMLARTLANQFTRLVFIPSQLVTYYAFRYFDNGVGKSYLDNIKVLCSLRAILLFSKVMAMTKNSIAVTHVNMTLDPNDPDPQKTIEIAMHDIAKMRQQYFPLGINSPVDLVDWIQRAGFEFSFEGHPGLPQTKFDFETKNLQHILPDSDLDENLRKQTYMSFGLSPEVVDNGFSSEFATTVIANNILLAKRVMTLQDLFTNHLSDSARKIITNDAIIIEELLQALMDNKAQVEKFLTDEEKEFYNTNEKAFLNNLLERFIENISLELPKPDITSIETQLDAYDKYVESLDKTLDAWISSEFATSDLVGEINANIDSIKHVLRNYYLRAWMAENGFMSELNDIVTSDEDGCPTLDIFDINKGHLEGLIRSSTKFIESLQNIKHAADTDLKNMNIEPGTSDEYSSYEESGNESGSDDFGFDTGDFGGDLDTGNEEDLGTSSEEDLGANTEESEEPEK